VNDAFNWWMLLVGLVVGAGLVWLVLADGRRHDADVAERERASEARWIAETLRAAGRRVDDGDALMILSLHEAYLSAPPPDELDDDEDIAAEAEPWHRSPSQEPPPAAPPAPIATSSGSARSAPAEARAPMAHPIATGDAMDGSARDR
jgi:hypothetical protein